MKNSWGLTKKLKQLFFNQEKKNIYQRFGVAIAVVITVSKQEKNAESSTTADPNIAQDPYTSFPAEKLQREMKWATDREAKRTKEELNG